MLDGTSYCVYGSGSDVPVVLIHGLGLTKSTWDDHIPLLAETMQVVTYDLFGHGESNPPPTTPSLSMFADQLISLADHLHVDRMHLVGFSLGGMINRRVAMDHPDRVTSLAILNSPHERSADAQRLVEQRAIDSAAGGPGATIDATLERWFTPDAMANRPDLVGHVRETVLANDHDAYAACRYVLANGVVELIDPETPIRHPTLVMTCENDTGSTPAMSEAIASEIEGSRCVIMPRLQHIGLLERPELFTNELLKFWKELDP